MGAFTKIQSIAAPLMRDNIDTDAIIPSREMGQISKEGFADGLFAAWRYVGNASLRTPNPDFILNRAPYDRAAILVAGNNFGCGSSREHAVWALKEWGIRAIIAPGFGSIFFSNCLRNRVLPIVLPEAVVERVASAAEEAPVDNQLTIDLASRSVRMGEECWSFDMSEADRAPLLQGLDEIAVTLIHQDWIDKFEEEDRRQRPWAYL